MRIGHAAWHLVTNQPTKLSLKSQSNVVSYMNTFSPLSFVEGFNNFVLLSLLSHMSHVLHPITSRNGRYIARWTFAFSGLSIALVYCRNEVIEFVRISTVAYYGGELLYMRWIVLLLVLYYPDWMICSLLLQIVLMWGFSIEFSDIRRHIRISNATVDR